LFSLIEILSKYYFPEPTSSGLKIKKIFFGKRLDLLEDR